MSNAQVGNAYQQIIADVIESSRVDFEEGGVEDSVLEEMRSVWQQKLSSLQVAAFPWDPKPDPPQAIVQPPTLPSNAGNYHMNNAQNVQGQNSMPQQPPVMNNNINGGVRVKTEPGMESPPIGGMSQPPYQNPTLSMPVPNTAGERAAQHLQHNYGHRAAASINAIQGGAQRVQQQNPQQPQNIQQVRMQEQQQHAMAQRQQQMQQIQQQQQHTGQMPQQSQIPQQGQAPQQGPIPQQGQMQQPRPNLAHERYRQAMANQAQKQMQSHTGQQPGQNGVNTAQTDGAGDKELESMGLIKQVDANGDEITMGRIEVDGLIRQKIEAMGQKMEGGGLMLPLKQASTSATRQRKVAKLSRSLAQHDGPGSDGVKDEEFDEDAINSDLDDPDDGANDDEDDEDGMGHIMLCMYDKVQRVKNKWHVKLCLKY
ncbi:hypothetical protein HYALB_00008208 [Hymenoscyphus albidus]|uniref:Uncharacterized protein n=1 Tax=Hymenoscyphus albidus TaxID=595503 RepID=A0A9N9LZ01_9HELO|nr:hypothetical protein HYALB_00008208 [Hymenoscyphus albidus]